MRGPLTDAWSALRTDDLVRWRIVRGERRRAGCWLDGRRRSNRLGLVKDFIDLLVRIAGWHHSLVGHAGLQTRTLTSRWSPLEQAACQHGVNVKRAAIKRRSALIGPASHLRVIQLPIFATGETSVVTTVGITQCEMLADHGSRG